MENAPPVVEIGHKYYYILTQSESLRLRQPDPRSEALYVAKSQVPYLGYSSYEAKGSGYGAFVTFSCVCCPEQRLCFSLAASAASADIHQPISNRSLCVLLARPR
jgi:hypothetical protein